MGPLLILIVLMQIYSSYQSIPSCDSRVFCQGNLLHAVQMAKLYPDSKTFVDMKLKNDEKITLNNFEQLVQNTSNNPTKDQMKKFVEENFEEGNEFEIWTPSDYTETPKLLSRIENEGYRHFAESLVKVWPKLAKKIKKEVLENPNLYTLLPVKNGFVIPGGRFKEFYYWDSYWIIKGLLLSDMHDTVKGMLENFLFIVEKYGFVPNGARIYYLNRSQPPLLSLMVKSYMDATNNLDWLKNNIQTLDKELRFWLTKKLIDVEKDGVNYTLAHYNSESPSPRPESYFEDHTLVSSFKSDEEKMKLWMDLKSAAESGWDFSSRWIVDSKGTNQANLTQLQTRRIVPVDLNSYLCQAFRIIAEFYIKLKDYENAEFWFQKSSQWELNIEEVFYNRNDGIWYDYDAELKQPRKYFYPSNFAPLWTGSYSPSANNYGQRAAEYIIKQNITEFQGGIPASLEDTREQWDYPNAWPPLQSLVVLGLQKTGDCDAKKIAKEFATKWINANIIGFNNTNEMFEKYDALVPGQYGGGGEYVVQSGFGWTNGVVFEFIDKFFTRRVKKVL